MATLKDIEARISTLEDERQLRELLTMYCIAADLGWNEAFARLYTDDAIVDHDPLFVRPQHRFEGRDGILEYLNNDAHKGIERRSNHHAVCGPIIYYIDGDEAEAEGYSLNFSRNVETANPGEEQSAAYPDVTIAMAAFNHWKFRRVDGVWRISQRRARAVGANDIQSIFDNSITKLATFIGADAPASSKSA